MNAELAPRFTHRLNKNGTTASICHGCHRNVGTSSNESDLLELEKIHVCDPADAARFTVESEPRFKRYRIAIHS